MSRKIRSSERWRSLRDRARVPRLRLRLLAWFVASKAPGRARSLDMIGWRDVFESGGGRRNGWFRRRHDQSAPAAATDLTALAPSRAGLVGRPLVGRALFVGGATAFAGDLPLFFGRHRCKSSTLFALTCIHHYASVFKARGAQPRVRCATWRSRLSG